MQRDAHKRTVATLSVAKASSRPPLVTARPPGGPLRSIEYGPGWTAIGGVREGEP